MVELKDIINLDSYPINEQQNKKYKDLIKQYRGELDSSGCCSLPNFINETSIIRMHNEFERNEIRPIVAKTYPLKDIKQAQKEFLLKKHTGKLVVIPPHDNV